MKLFTVASDTHITPGIGIKVLEYSDCGNIHIETRLSILPRFRCSWREVRILTFADSGANVIHE